LAWRAEISKTAREDIRALYTCLVNLQHRRFGHDLAAADKLASERIAVVRRNARKLASAPYRGTCHTIAGHTYRHVTIDRAVYWFTLDELAEVLRIEAIFFGGQDHLDRMFNRLREEGEAP
jgi:plasmid stabilization system protein ParE